MFAASSFIDTSAHGHLTEEWMEKSLCLTVVPAPSMAACVSCRGRLVYWTVEAAQAPSPDNQRPLASCTSTLISHGPLDSNSRRLPPPSGDDDCIHSWLGRSYESGMVFSLPDHLDPFHSPLWLFSGSEGVFCDTPLIDLFSSSPMTGDLSYLTSSYHPNPALCAECLPV